MSAPAEGYPQPALHTQHDLAAFAPYLWEAAAILAAPTAAVLGAATFNTPAAVEFPTAFYYELLVAQAFQESQWTLSGYRYEPNYDRIYVSNTTIPRGLTVSPFQRWSRSAAWLRQGPTIQDWFGSHPSRAKERFEGRDYATIAQTRIAASYGPMQCMYPTAVDEGYTDTPENLALPENIVWPVKHLINQVQWARAKGWDEPGCLKIALARYNGGAYGNISPTVLDDYLYVQFVEKRFRECWGKPCFADVTLPPST